MSQRVAHRAGVTDQPTGHESPQEPGGMGRPVWLQSAPSEAAAAGAFAAAAGKCWQCGPCELLAPSAYAAAMHCPTPRSTPPCTLNNLAGMSVSERHHAHPNVRSFDC